MASVKMVLIFVTLPFLPGHSVIQLNCLIRSIEKGMQTRINLNMEMSQYAFSCRQAILFNPLNPDLNPTCYLLALLGAHHFLHVSRMRVKLLTFRLLMSHIYIYIYIYIYIQHLFLMFLDHTQRRSTVGRTPLDE